MQSRAIGRWAIVLALVSGCATGAGGAGRRDGGGSGGFDATSPLDSGAAVLEDAGDAEDGSADDDAGSLPRGDAGSPSGDAGAPVDAGPGGPVACTAASAGTVCGGRPCVDGYCCDVTCEGACRACDVPGSEGVCSPSAAGTLCDDADACTHGDRCDGAGACGGTAITCSDTACLDRSCDGTANCAESILSGATCDDGDATTSGDVCAADGSCSGTPSGCAMPADACTNGTQSRDRCANARIIGRAVAGSASGYVVNDDTCYASNRFDTSCWDAGADHAYRLFVRAGESVSVRYEVDWACPTYDTTSWSGTLKILEGGGCDDRSCGTEVLCERYVDDYTTVYDATRDTWIVIVADGSTAFDDEGDYRLTVRLTCGAGGCGC